jgi:hypothetical protein
MAGSSSRKFPQYLSRPFQVLWFEVDELAIFLFTLTVALVYGGLAWLVFIAIQYLYTRTKRSKPRGFLKQLLYVGGFIRMKNYPEYFQQEFHE